MQTKPATGGRQEHVDSMKSGDGDRGEVDGSGADGGLSGVDGDRDRGHGGGAGDGAGVRTRARAAPPPPAARSSSARRTRSGGTAYAG